MEKKIYLVGTTWYSADQGDFPNSSDFPYFAFVDLEEAKAKYNELSSHDRSWGFGFEKAYLVSMTPGVKGHETIYGNV